MPVPRFPALEDDPAPIGAAPDIERRIAWLLACSRLHHPDPAYVDRSAFASALADAGHPVTEPVVEGWESADGVMPWEALRAWERVVGAESGTLTSVTGYIRASLPTVGTPVVRPTLDADSPEFARRRDHLLDLVEDRSIGPAEWSDLGWHLAAEGWDDTDRAEDLAELVVRQVPRATRVAYRQLSTAAMNLSTLPVMQGPLVARIRAYIADPDVQVLQNPVGMLDQLPTRESAQLVLDLFEKPPTRGVYGMAIWLATQKVIRGDFAPSERARLGVAVLAKWRSSAVEAQTDLAQLIGVLPQGFQATLARAAEKSGHRRFGYVLEHGEDAAAATAEAVAGAIAGPARAAVPDHGTYDDNPMLVRLVRESLFHRESERRHLASLLVGASPFREPVAGELLNVLRRPGHSDVLRERAATLVRYLCTDSHRMPLHRFIDDPTDGVAVPIAQSFGHIGFSTTSDQALRRTIPAEESAVGRARFYALGMTASPGLEAIANSPSSPEWQRRAAAWWQRMGPAIR